MRTRERMGAKDRAVALLALASILLGACGGSDSTDASDRRATTTTEASTATSNFTTETTDATDVGSATTIDDSGSTLPGGTPVTTRSGTPTTRRASTTTTTTGSTATTAAPKQGTPSEEKAVIRLGSLYSSVNATTGAPLLKEAFKIGTVWQNTVNAAGGINGYQVQIVWRDNKGDTSKSVQNIKELERAGVLAIVGQDAATQLPASSKFLNDSQLPIVGGVPYATEFDSDPMFFPVAAGYYAGVYANVAAARDAGAKAVFHGFCAEFAACASTVPVWREGAQREGLRYQSQSASLTATDYTAICLRARDFGADYIQNAGLSQANLVRDCQRQNYHPTYGIGGAANQAAIDASAGERVAGGLSEFGIFYDGPEVQRFRAALGKTDLMNSNTPPTQVSVQSWLGFEMAGAVIKRLTKPNPSRADFLEAIYSIKGESLDGQIAPVDYNVQRPSSGGHASQDCWTELTVKDGKYFHINRNGQVVNRLTFICGTGKRYVSVTPS